MITLWNLETGEQEQTLRGHQEDISQVLFSPNSQYLASGSYAGELLLWDLARGGSFTTLYAEESVYPTDLSFSRDGSVLADLDNEGNVAFWNTETGEQIDFLSLVLEGNAKRPISINAIAFSPQEDIFVTGLRDGYLQIWEADQYEEVLVGFFAHNDRIYDVTFNNEGTWLASVSGDNEVTVWNVDSILGSGDLDYVNLVGHTDDVREVVFRNDGQVVFSRSDEQIIQWKADPCLDPLGELLSAEPVSAFTMAASPDGQLIASDGVGYDIGIEDRDTGEFIITGVDTEIVLRDSQTGQRIATLAGHGDDVLDLAFSHDGQFLISGGNLGVTLWDVAKQTQLTDPTNPAFTSEITSVTPFTISQLAWSPNQSLIASLGVGDDNTSIILQEVLGQTYVDGGERFKPHQTVQAEEGRFFQLFAFHPEGSLLATGDNFGDVQLWDVDTGQRITETVFSWLGYPTLSLAFDHEGEQLAVGFANGDIVIWDIKTVQTPTATLDYSTGVSVLAFHPEGQILVSASQDGDVQLWDIVEKQLIDELDNNPNTQQVRDLFFSPDGLTLYSGQFNEAVYLGEAGSVNDCSTAGIIKWSMSPQVWLDKACEVVSGGDLTPQEWIDYVGDISTRRETCEGVAFADVVASEIAGTPRPTRTPVVPTRTPTPISLPPTATATPTGTPTPVVAVAPAAPVIVGSTIPASITGRLVFPVDDGAGHYDIWAVDLPNNEPYIYWQRARQPDFSAQGQLLVNNQGNQFGENIGLLDANGNWLRQVSDSPEDSHPSFNPEGDNFVYANDEIIKDQGNPQPLIFAPCGGLVAPSSNTSEACQDMVGRGRLAFGRFPVWLQGAIRENHVVIEGRFGVTTIPSWQTERVSGIKLGDQSYNPIAISGRPTDSYDNKILFFDSSSGNWEAYAFDLATQQRVNLSNSPGSQDGLPTASPDGQWAAFVSDRGGVWAIWAVPITGGEAIKLFDFPNPVPWANDTIRGDWTIERISWGP